MSSRIKRRSCSQTRFRHARYVLFYGGGVDYFVSGFRNQELKYNTTRISTSRWIHLSLYTTGKDYYKGTKDRSLQL